MNGWIRIYRQMTEWGWYSDPATKAVFLHLLLTANWEKPKQYKGVPIEIGQVVIGRKALALALGLSECQVRIALTHLTQTGEIRLQTTNRFTVVTIEKWGDFQGDEEESDQQIANKQPTNSQQIANKQPTNSHILRNKEIRNKKERNIYKEELVNPYFFGKEGDSKGEGKNDQSTKGVDKPVDNFGRELEALHKAYEPVRRKIG